jgi:hypothetical protein
VYWIPRKDNIKRNSAGSKTKYFFIDSLTINNMNLRLFLNVISLAVVMTAGILAAGGTTISLQTAAAQIIDNSTATSLGNPFFVEKGRIIGQRVLNVSPVQLEFTFVANATINGNINATNTGTTINTVQPNGVFHTKGQGFIMTQDGEVATYTNQVIGNLTEEGNVLSRGAGFWSTPSTGKLAFLNDMMSVFKLEVDKEGNISAIEWEWK